MSDSQGRGDGVDGEIGVEGRVEEVGNWWHEAQNHPRLSLDLARVTPRAARTKSFWDWCRSRYVAWSLFSATLSLLESRERSEISAELFWAGDQSKFLATSFPRAFAALKPTLMTRQPEMSDCFCYNKALHYPAYMMLLSQCLLSSCDIVADGRDSSQCRL